MKKIVDIINEKGALTIAVIIVIWIALRVLFYENELSSENRIFTIGIIKELGYGQGNYCIYEYYYSGKRYEQRENYGEVKPAIDSTYLVVFSSKNKSFSRLIQNVKVEKKYFNSFETKFWISSPPFGVSESVIREGICGKCVLSF